MAHLSTSSSSALLAFPFPSSNSSQVVVADEVLVEPAYGRWIAVRKPAKMWELYHTEIHAPLLKLDGINELTFAYPTFDISSSSSRIGPPVVLGISYRLGGFDVRAWHEPDAELADSTIEALNIAPARQGSSKLKTAKSAAKALHLQLSPLPSSVKGRRVVFIPFPHASPSSLALRAYKSLVSMTSFESLNTIIFQLQLPDQQQDMSLIPVTQFTMNHVPRSLQLFSCLLVSTTDIGITIQYFDDRYSPISEFIPFSKCTEPHSIKFSPSPAADTPASCSQLTNANTQEDTQTDRDVSASNAERNTTENPRGGVEPHDTSSAHTTAAGNAAVASSSSSSFSSYSNSDSFHLYDETTLLIRFTYGGSSHIILLTLDTVNSNLEIQLSPVCLPFPVACLSCVSIFDHGNGGSRSNTQGHTVLLVSEAATLYVFRDVKLLADLKHDAAAVTLPAPSVACLLDSPPSQIFCVSRDVFLVSSCNGLKLFVIRPKTMLPSIPNR